MFARSVSDVDEFEALDRRFVLQGEYAFETGIAVQRGSVDGQRIEVRGDYMMLFARQADGTWLIRHLVAGNPQMTRIN